MTGTIDWNLHRTFLAVMQSGSLSAAARALDASAATVGRQIAALEDALGVSLFTRSPSGLAATRDAEDLLAHAQTMAAAAAALQRAARGTASAQGGAVRITASELMGVEILPAILKDFRERHPQIVLEVSLTNRTEDLLRRDADIAIRMTEPLQEALVRKQVGHARIGLFAHQDYVRLHGLPDGLDALGGHTLIGYDRDSFGERLAAGAGIAVRREMFALRSDNDLAQLALLRAGCGIGSCQVTVARRDPRLVPVLPDLVGFTLPVWVAMHGDQRRVPRIRLAFDHLAGALAERFGPLAAPQRPPGRRAAPPRTNAPVERKRRKILPTSRRALA